MDWKPPSLVAGDLVAEDLVTGFSELFDDAELLCSAALVLRGVQLRTML